MMPTEQSAESIPLRREPVDIGMLLELTMEVMHLQARTLDVTLTVRAADDVPATLHLDRNKVAWAVANLVGTSLRHVRRGTQSMPGGSIDVDVTYDAVRSELVIEVRDNGPGIPLEKLKGLLSRGRQSHPGAALALLLIEDIAVAHGGRIEIASDTDPFKHFTKVRLAIPAR
jgi:signal transduction histidine kinase